MDDRARRRDGLTPVRMLTTALVVVVLVAGVLVTALVMENRRQAQQTRAALAQVHQEGRRMRDLQAQAAALGKKAVNPTVEVWSTCGGAPCKVGPQQVLLGGVPDAFVLHFEFTGSAPVTLSFLTFHQWTRFDDCNLRAACVTSGYPTYPPSVSESVDFTLGAGCAAYLYVLTASVPATVQPHVSATYQPPPTVTGQCEGSR